MITAGGFQTNPIVLTVSEGMLEASRSLHDLYSREIGIACGDIVLTDEEKAERRVAHAAWDADNTVAYSGPSWQDIALTPSRRYVMAMIADGSEVEYRRLAPDEARQAAADLLAAADACSP